MMRYHCKACAAASTMQLGIRRALLAFILSTVPQLAWATRNQFAKVQEEAASMYVDGLVPFPGDMISGVKEYDCVRFGNGVYDKESGQCFIPGATMTRVVSCDHQSDCMGPDTRYIAAKWFCYYPHKFTSITPARYQSDCLDGIFTRCGGGKCLRK
ncbi:1a [Symbiodinium sp. CCMP2592]|nr:1a [Symbiodinium sp. CCMP2592]